MHQEERPGFVRRNIDAMVIAVISALLGAVVGAAVTKIVDRAWPNSTIPVAERSTTKAIQPSTQRPSP
jgi:tetrahydromethanopterin S-methyltransferase subunit C